MVVGSSKSRRDRGIRIKRDLKKRGFCYRCGKPTLSDKVHCTKCVESEKKRYRRNKKVKWHKTNLQNKK